MTYYIIVAFCMFIAPAGCIAYQLLAQHILGIQGGEALILVRELGFANTAFGVVGVSGAASLSGIAS